MTEFDGDRVIGSNNIDLVAAEVRMFCTKDDDAGDSNLPSLTEAAALYPDGISKISRKFQPVVQLTLRGMTSTKIGELLNIKPATVRKYRERARDELIANGNSSLPTWLVMAFFWTKWQISARIVTTTSTAYAGATASLISAGFLTAIVGLPGLEAPNANFVAVPSLTTHEKSAAPAAEHMKSPKARPVPFDGIAATTTALSLRQTATVSRRETGPASSLFPRTRGNMEMSPNLEGGPQGAHDFSVVTPIGELESDSEAWTTGPTTAWRACNGLDSKVCRKSNALIEESTPSKISVTGGREK